MDRHRATLLLIAKCGIIICLSMGRLTRAPGESPMDHRNAMLGATHISCAARMDAVLVGRRETVRSDNPRFDRPPALPSGAGNHGGIVLTRSGQLPRLGSRSCPTKFAARTLIYKKKIP